jgi:hypothetical protein
MNVLVRYQVAVGQPIGIIDKTAHRHANVARLTVLYPVVPDLGTQRNLEIVVLIRDSAEQGSGLIDNASDLLLPAIGQGRRFGTIRSNTDEHRVAR